MVIVIVGEVHLTQGALAAVDDHLARTDVAAAIGTMRAVIGLRVGQCDGAYDVELRGKLAFGSVGVIVQGRTCEATLLVVALGNLRLDHVSRTGGEVDVGILHHEHEHLGRADGGEIAAWEQAWQAVAGIHHAVFKLPGGRLARFGRAVHIWMPGRGGGDAGLRLFYHGGLLGGIGGKAGIAVGDKLAGREDSLGVEAGIAEAIGGLKDHATVFGGVVVSALVAVQAHAN